MRRKTLTAALAALLLNSNPSAASTAVAVPLTPSGPWHVDFASSTCVLDRPYGADGGTKLSIKPSLLGDRLDIEVAQTTTKTSHENMGKSVVAIAGKAVTSDTGFSASSKAGVRSIHTSIGDDNDHFDLSTIRDVLSVDAKGEQAYFFALPGIERAIPVLEKCLDDLRHVYKVSEADVGVLATRPKGNLVSFFSVYDYPREALNNREQGLVNVLFWVEANGMVSNCQVIESTASRSIDQATCGVIIGRGRFRPAKDAQKKSVRAPMVGRINWQLP